MKQIDRDECFSTCHEPSCNAGAPCKKIRTRRVRAGEAQPSDWLDIEPDLPIDVVEPDPEPISGFGIVMVGLTLLAAWAGVYLMVAQ